MRTTTTLARSRLTGQRRRRHHCSKKESVAHIFIEQLMCSLPESKRVEAGAAASHYSLGNITTTYYLPSSFYSFFFLHEEQTYSASASNNNNKEHYYSTLMFTQRWGRRRRREFADCRANGDAVGGESRFDHELILLNKVCSL